MRPRAVVWTGLFLAGLSGIIQAQEKIAAEPEQVYGSPKAVFEAAQKASKKKDYKAFAMCLVPDSREILAGQMVTTAAMFKAFSAFDKEGKMKDKLADLDKIFEKHGLTKDTLDKIGKETKGSKDQVKTFKALSGPVKDKPVFIGEVISWMDKLGGGKGKSGPLDNAELKDLKVEGDKASGMVVATLDVGIKKDPIDFLKTKKGWLIVLPLPKASRKVNKEAPPPPSPAEKKKD